MATQNHNLHRVAQFALFVSSYLPLFLLIILKQLTGNKEYLNWGGFNIESIFTFGQKFGLSFILTVICIIGWFGYRMTISNIEDVADNGVPVTVTDVKNKNSEAIGYIATYIIPFLFQSFDNWFDCVSVLFLMVIIYRIYINSSLLLINPLLSYRFAIYEVEFTQSNKIKNGLIISPEKYLQEETKIKIYELGHKLYFAKIIN